MLQTAWKHNKNIIAIMTTGLFANQMCIDDFANQMCIDDYDSIE